MSTSFICVECGTVYEVPTTSYVCNNPACPGKGLTGLLVPNKKKTSSPQVKEIKQAQLTPAFTKGIRPFSFKGRIRRREFGISLIIYFFGIGLLAFIATVFSKPDTKFLLLPAVLVILIPLFWFYFAQAAKRMHDLNLSAWNLFVPIYITWLIFREGTKGKNAYGEDPKKYTEPENKNLVLQEREERSRPEHNVVPAKSDTNSGVRVVATDSPAERVKPPTAQDNTVKNKFNYKIAFLVSVFIIAVLVTGWFFYNSQTKIKEDKTIEEPIVSDPITPDGDLVTPGGMTYRVYKGDGSQKIYHGNVLKINIIAKIRDSVYFSSTKSKPEYLAVDEVKQPFDLEKVWTTLHVGDSIVVTGLVDATFENLPSQFKLGDKADFYIKILAVFADTIEVEADRKKVNDELVADKEKSDSELLSNEIIAVGKYLADNNIIAAQTLSGAYIEIIDPGTGYLIDSGKQVSVNYTGTTFSGSIFASNIEPGFQYIAPMQMIAGEGKMIKGFEEAILMMRPRSSARVYIPSMLAYRGEGSPIQNIKPFENIIFTITIVDVKDYIP